MARSPRSPDQAGEGSAQGASGRDQPVASFLQLGKSGSDPYCLAEDVEAGEDGISRELPQGWQENQSLGSSRIWCFMT